MNEVWKGHCPCPSDTSLVRPYTRCPRLVGAKKENVRCQDEEDCGCLMSGGLLVPSGCHSEYWPLGDFNKVNLLSPSSRGFEVKIRRPAGLVPGEMALPGSQITSFSLCVHTEVLWFMCKEWEGELSPPLIRPPVLSDQDRILETSFNLNYCISQDQNQEEIDKYAGINSYSDV